MNTMDQFLIRADEVALARGMTRTTLSRRLFGSGTRLDQLRGGADVGTRRFQQAIEELENIAGEALKPSAA